MKLNGLFDGFGEQKPVPPQQQSVSNPNYQERKQVSPNNNQTEIKTPETPASEIEKQQQKTDSLINQNLPKSNNDKASEKNILAKEQRENQEKITLIDELINEYLKRKKPIFSEDFTANEEILTEEQAQNWRLKL